MKMYNTLIIVTLCGLLANKEIANCEKPKPKKRTRPVVAKVSPVKLKTKGEKHEKVNINNHNTFSSVW